MSLKQDTLSILEVFSPISLAEMKSVKLMNRVDTKYVAPVSMLKDLLKNSISDYRTQVNEGKAVAAYDTLYFDTENLDMYTRHHDKYLTRNKIRTRTYVDSALSFLEVKHKNNKGRTKKKRIVITEEDFGNFNGNEAAVEFLRGQVTYNNKELKPQLRTIFNRITLVNNNLTERLTIDFNLRFENKQTGKVSELPNVMIIELKQDGHQNSKMKNILIDLHITPFRISKYCIGTVLTNDNVKYNRFKTKIIYLNKISK